MGTVVEQVGSQAVGLDDEGTREQVTNVRHGVWRRSWRKARTPISEGRLGDERQRALRGPCSNKDRGDPCPRGAWLQVAEAFHGAQAWPTRLARTRTEARSLHTLFSTDRAGAERWPVSPRDALLGPGQAAGQSLLRPKGSLASRDELFMSCNF